MTSNDLLTQVTKAARSVAYQWPGVIEADDLEQEVHLHILSSPGTQRDLDEMDEVSRYRTVSKIAHRIASQERTDYDYYKGSYRYSLKEVKDLLDDGAILEDQDEFNAEAADLFESIANLNDRYHEAIRSRYVDRVVPPRGAEAMALSRAIEELVEGMNRAHKSRFVDDPECVGTRPILTRTAAIALTSRQYNGENLDWGRL